MAEDFKPVWAVGLMTGTVLDGNIDVAMLKTDGVSVERFGAYTLAPYPQSTRDLLEETLAVARKWNFEGPEPAIFAKAEEVLTRAQSAAVKALVEAEGLTMADIGVVGFHGQSVLHRAPTKTRIGDTRQLGDGALMVEQQTILGAPGEGMQGVADLPQESLALAEDLQLGVVHEALGDDVLVTQRAEIALGHPTDHLDVAQPAGRALEIGLELVLGVVVLEVAGNLLLPLALVRVELGVACILAAGLVLSDGVLRLAPG